MRYHVFGEILNGFQRTASGGFQVHDDVRHAVGLPLLPKLDDAFGTAAQVDIVVELGRDVRVFQELDEIRHAKGFPGFAVAQFFERVDDVAQFFEGDAVPNPCVGFFGNPFQLLAGAADSESAFGIVQLPHYLVQTALDTGSLKSVLSDFQPKPVPVMAVYPSRKQLSPKVRALVDMMTQAWGKSV